MNLGHDFVLVNWVNITNSLSEIIFDICINSGCSNIVSFPFWSVKYFITTAEADLVTFFDITEF